MNFVNSAKKIQAEITQNIESDNIVEAGEKYDQLQEIYQALAKAVTEIKLIKLGCQTQMIAKLRKIREDIEILEQPNATLEDIQRLQLKDKGIKEVAPGITLRTVMVPSEDFVPDSPLYFLRSTGEYAIKIQGTIIKGNIKNIEPRSTKTVKCRMRNCERENCKWGHDNRDAWCVSNFMYTTEPLKKSNMYMRHIGSRNTLKSEIHSATRQEKESRMQQLAHDMLIQLCIARLDNI